MEDTLPAVQSRVVPNLITRPEPAVRGLETRPPVIPPVAADTTPLPTRRLRAAADEGAPPALDLSGDDGRWESADRTVFAWLFGVTALLAAGVVTAFAAFDR